MASASFLPLAAQIVGIGRDDGLPGPVSIAPEVSAVAPLRLGPPERLYIADCCPRHAGQVIRNNPLREALGLAPPGLWHTDEERAEIVEKVLAEAWL